MWFWLIALFMYGENSDGTQVWYHNERPYGMLPYNVGDQELEL